MQWFMHFDPPLIMSVDNASVTGMDFSELLATDPDLYHVMWRDGRGELERQDLDNNANLNGLREEFVDLTPYVPLFQQFLTRLQEKNLLLDQAKKVQVDLIKQIFDSKRQLPYHYPVAAGDYWWDASDNSLYASTAGGLQNATVKLNEVIARLNALVANINSVVVADTNTMASTINTGISAIGNVLIAQVNSTVVQGVNSIVVNGINSDFAALADDIYNQIAYNGNLTIQHINNSVIGPGGNGETINQRLNTGAVGVDGAPAASPGIAYQTGQSVAQIPYSFGIISDYTVPYINSIAPGTFSSVVAIRNLSWSNIGNVTPANTQWIPIGSTVPVNVTPDEQTAILQGIAARTNELFIIKNEKIVEVNALTTVEAVIAYDVLADWPDIPVPPGYKAQPSLGASGGGITVVGTPPPPVTGVPEAPQDGVTYGRRNAAWNPALALSNNTLDGGSF